LIAYLRGRLVEKNLPYVLIETGGLGYRVEVSLNTFEQLPEPSSEIKLLTQQVIREDAHLLYGFGDEEERRLFIAITRVSGFGPRVAMSMLSASRPHELASAIQLGDKAMLQKIPGIGAKSAERLIIELRDKLGEALETSHGGARAHSGMSDAEAALLHLGYRQAEVNKALRSLNPGDDTATLVRLALRHLSSQA